MAESDERLLREDERTLMRHRYSNPEYDSRVELEVSDLGFMNCPHRLPSNLIYSLEFGSRLPEPRTYHDEVDPTV